MHRLTQNLKGHWVNILTYLIEYNRYLNIVGIVVILLIAYLFSRNRSQINFRLVLQGLGLQMLIGFLVLRTTIGRAVVQTVAVCVSALYMSAGEGLTFLFGNLTDASMPWGFIFVIKVLPIIVFFGAFMALLFHFGLIQKAVVGVNWLIRPLLGTSGAETLCAIANSFLGQTEAPLLVRHYLANMTKSEMLVVMVSGMATISGAILVVFVAMGVPASHLLASSVMSIPASIFIAKMLLPETEKPQTLDRAQIKMERTSSNALDAISQGTSDGLQLALNVGAMLLSFLALLALINYFLGYMSVQGNNIIWYINQWLSSYGSAWHIAWQLPILSVEYLLAYLLAPFGYLLGFTGDEALAAGQLIGTKVAVNELIAYSKMVTMGLSDRTVNILTYALCGFSNFSCIGIQIGGIGALVPQKRQWLTELGLYAVLGGALSNLLSAMIAALLL